MRNILIAYSGKAKSGKTTCSNLLKKYIHEHDLAERLIDGSKYNYLNNPNTFRVQIHSFATKLKEIAHDIFSWDGSKENVMLPRPEGMFDGPDQIPAPDKGRQLLVNIGKKFREIRPTIWLDYVINNIKKIDQNDCVEETLFVIDDLRYRNELNAAKTFHSCVSVRITRKVGALDLDDQSEKDLDNSEFDFYIDNDGTMDELKIKVAKLYQDIMERYNDPAYKFAGVKHGNPELDKLEKDIKQNLTGWSE